MKTEIIVHTQELEQIINTCKVCHVAMVDEENHPYVLPFNFAYKEGILFLHSGNEGRKNKIFKKNPSVCVAFTIEKEMYSQSESIGCSYSMLFESVLLYGNIESVEDFEQKKEILHYIMHKYTENRDYTFAEPAIRNVACFQIQQTKLTGKRRG